MGRIFRFEDGTERAKPRGLVNFILDRSGSMQTVQAATISGFNEYLQSLKNDADVDYLFSLTLFDTDVEQRYITVPVLRVEPLTPDTYAPRGMTALLDAVGNSVTALDIDTLKNLDVVKILNVIQTDGEENSSKKFTKDAIASLIKEREALPNWTFVFLGADQNAWSNSQQYAVAAGNTQSYRSGDTQQLYQNMSMSTGNFMKSRQLKSQNYFADYDKDRDNPIDLDALKKLTDKDQK